MDNERTSTEHTVLADLIEVTVTEALQHYVVDPTTVAGKSPYSREICPLSVVARLIANRVILKLKGD